MQRRTKINNEYANTKLEAEKDGKNCPFENQVALPTGSFLFLRQEFVPFNARPRLVTHLF